MTGPTLRLAAADGRTIPTDAADSDQLAHADAAPCCERSRWHHERIEAIKALSSATSAGYRRDQLDDRREWHRRALSIHRCPADG